MIPTAIALFVAGIIGGVLWLRGYARRVSADADAAFAGLAGELGAPLADPAQRKLEGTWSGRKVWLSQGSVLGRGGTDYHVRIKVPVDTATTLELHGQSSALAARLLGEVELGDPAFDASFIVRTSDPSRAARAIAPALRPRLIEWQRTGWLARVFVKDGFLHIEQNRGLHRAAEVVRAGEMVRVAVAIAEGLER